MRRKGDGQGGKKPGGFHIFKDAHDRLRRAGGYYIFCVYRIRGTGVQALDTKFVHAGNLPYFTWSRSGHRNKQGARNGQEVLLKNLGYLRVTPRHLFQKIYE
jgi:hypothetical protein